MGNPDRRHVEYALEWMGIFTDDQAIEGRAQALYRDKAWENDNYCVRFVCFGRYSNKKLSNAFPRLLQINHQHMMEFVHRRLTTYCNVFIERIGNRISKTLSPLSKLAPTQICCWPGRWLRRNKCPIAANSSKSPYPSKPSTLHPPARNLSVTGTPAHYIHGGHANR